MIGRALGRTLEAELALAALRKSRRHGETFCTKTAIGPGIASLLTGPETADLYKAPVADVDRLADV